MGPSSIAVVFTDGGYPVREHVSPQPIGSHLGNTGPFWQIRVPLGKLGVPLGILRVPLWEVTGPICENHGSHPENGQNGDMCRRGNRV